MIARAFLHETISQRRSAWRARAARTVLRVVGESAVITETEPVTDTGLLMLRIAQSQDKAAFKALFLQLAPKVKAYLIRHGALAAQAEDLAQETLLTVWRKAAYFDPKKASVSAWVFTIARNLRIDALRRERSAVAYAVAVHEPDESPPSPEAENETAEREGRIRAAISTLPAEQLEVIRLSFFSDKPHAEIASELSLPLGTVKSRLRLALARLRGMVGDLQ
jgi:RNA polymerase sigma-70 factor, ECF subfamily